MLLLSSVLRYPVKYFTCFAFGISRNTSFCIFISSCLSSLVKLTSLTFSSRWLRAVFDPLGGQTVTVGNSSSVMGWVVIVVDTGDSCHSLYELVIMCMARAKQAATIATQAALAVRDLAVEMYTRPWIVLLSKKSRRVAEAIFIDFSL